MNNSQRIAHIISAIDTQTSKFILARELDCSIAELREFVGLHMPDRRLAFERLPAHPQQDEEARDAAVQAQIQRRNRRHFTERVAAKTGHTPPRARASDLADVDDLIAEVRERLGIGPHDRIFTALPLTVQAGIRERVQAFLEYTNGTRESEMRLTSVDRVIRG